MKHFRFEWKKLTKQKMIWGTVLLSLIAAISLYFFNYSVAEKLHENNIAGVKNTIQDIESWIENEEIELKKAEESGEASEIETIEGKIERFKGLILWREQWLEDYTTSNWQSIFQEDIAQLEEVEAGHAGIGVEEQNVGNFTIRVTKEETEWLMEQELEPVAHDSHFFFFHPTIYDQFTGKSLEAWKKLTKRYGETGLTYLYQMMPNYYLTIIILIGLFIFGNTISAESIGKKRGLHFFFVQPIPKMRLFMAKYVSGLLYLIAFILLIVAAPLVSSLFTKGIGSLQYPVLIYEGAIPNPFGDEFTRLSAENDLFHFIPMGEYFLQAIGLALVLAFFLYSLYLLISFFIKSPTINLLIVSGLTFGGMMALSPSKFNPFTYVDIHRVLNGEIAALSIDPSIHFQNGVILLVGLGFLLAVINLVVFRFKRI